MSATRIAGELQRAGVTVRAVGRPLAAPQVVTYAVEPSPATMRQALRQGARLQAALRTVDPPRIVQRGRWLLVEVPRAERRAVPLSAMRASGLAVDIGIAATGRRVTLDLGRTPHALVAGQTGSGKSVALRAIARGLALAPDAIELVLVDLDGDTWAPLEQAAALRHAIADDPLAARRALQSARDAMSDSARNRLIVCMIDEAQMLDEPAREAVRDIAQRGRKAGVHLVLATQYVRGDVLDRRLSDQLGARIVGRMQDAAAGRWAGSADAHTLTGAGDMIANVAGVETRVQVAYAAPDAAVWSAVPKADPRPAPEPDDDGLEIPHDALVWCAARQAIDGRLPGINRIADRFGVGKTKATRWQAEAIEELSHRPAPAPGGRVLPFRRAG